jgi:hypothetical protein
MIIVKAYKGLFKGPIADVKLEGLNNRWER